MSNPTTAASRIDDELATFLLREKVLTDAQLKTALDFQRAVGGSVDQVAVRLQLVDRVIMDRLVAGFHALREAESGKAPPDRAGDAEARLDAAVEALGGANGEEAAVAADEPPELASGDDQPSAPAIDDNDHVDGDTGDVADLEDSVAAGADDHDHDRVEPPETRAAVFDGAEAPATFEGRDSAPAPVADEPVAGAVEDDLELHPGVLPEADQKAYAGGDAAAEEESSADLLQQVSTHNALMLEGLLKLLIRKGVVSSQEIKEEIRKMDPSSTGF